MPLSEADHRKEPYYPVDLEQSWAFGDLPEDIKAFCGAFETEEEEV